MARPRVPLAVRLQRSIRIDPESGCWLFTGRLARDGYAKIGPGGAKRPPVTAHRVAYELFVGPIPEGLVLDHLCRVRHCVNPAHLEPVTSRENILRGDGLAAKNARKTHCKYGHLFDPGNTIAQEGRRACRTCRKRIEREHYARRLARSATGAATAVQA